jgi:hypothetical protein
MDQCSRAAAAAEQLLYLDHQMGSGIALKRKPQAYIDQSNEKQEKYFVRPGEDWPFIQAER